MMTLRLQEAIPNYTIDGDDNTSYTDDDVWPCPGCGAPANRVESTPEEIRSPLNCGRSYACCCRAWICTGCGARIVGSHEAPEMEWDTSGEDW